MESITLSANELHARIEAFMAKKQQRLEGVRFKGKPTVKTWDNFQADKKSKYETY